MNEKKWLCKTILYFVSALVLFAAVTVVVDPYFHYHKPIEGISYRLYEERYINDGIARNFDYDAVIVGASTVENFKTSEFNELFACNAIKLPFSGGSYRESSQALQTAFSHKEGIEKVLWGLDWTLIVAEPDYRQYEDYPMYLYDNNVWNDVNYVLNKDIMYHGTLNNILMTIRGETPTTFDEYAAWNPPTGYKVVMDSYERRETDAGDRGLNEEEKRLVTENIRENICTVIEQHPDTVFYIFFPPYSIVRWDEWNRYGRISVLIEAEEIATELLLQYDNVELYCFYENTELTFDLNNYKDNLHYSAEINSLILQWIKNGEYRLTEENYMMHLKNEKVVYLDFDYDSLFY